MYRITYGLLYLVSLLPMRALYVVSDLMYPFALFYRRKVTRRNLAEAFPELSDSERKKIEHRFYHQLCDYMVETVKLFSISKTELTRRMTFGGLDDIRHGFNDLNKDTFFSYLGHYGNWEWIASLQYWLPDCHCCQIYHPLYNKVFDRIFLKIRQQYGGECIPMKTSMLRLARLRKEGTRTVCGFISDQQPKWNAIHHFTPFLNHDTAVFTGTEQIGKRMDAMIFYAHVTRPSRGYYHCEFRPMEYNPKDTPDYELTDRFMQLLEHDIKAAPHLWLWTHKRWSRTKEEWERRRSQSEG